MNRFRTLVFVGALLGMSTESVAADSYTHGSACQPDKATAAAACVEYTNYGVHNACPATTATVECPLTSVDYPVGGLVASVFIGMYDRNSSSNIQCFVQQTDGAGDVAYSIPLNSTTGGPGTGIQNRVNNNVNQSLAYFWRAKCTIPPAQSGQFSHVVGFYLNGTGD